MGIVAGVNESTNTSRVVNSSSMNDTSAADLQSNFLTLLVTQLKNQDPTNPMDNAQLTSQLAQINTLSGIEKLNTTLGSISGQISNGQSLQATSLIGHGVMVQGSQILVGNKTTTPFGISLPGAATSVTATITDASGSVVQTIDLGALPAGVHTFQWDGSTTDGTTAADGKYNVSISASNAQGTLVSQPLCYAYVSGVSTASNGAVLDLGQMGKATLEDIYQII